MNSVDNGINHIMRNGIEVVRHIVRQADHRLAAMERDLAALSSIAEEQESIRLIVMRLDQTDQGALGVLLFDGRLFCTTLEPDENDPVRCQIPAGTYPLRPFSGTKFKNTLEIVVPNHTAVLFHNGSLERHSTMCVLVGYVPTYLSEGGRKLRAIIDSRRAYKRFKAQVVPQIRPGDQAAFIDFYMTQKQGGTHA
jgi:hypothetical protein